MEQHESFGMISVGRTQCSPAVSLFGSPIKHDNYLSITIKTAIKEHNLNVDKYYGKDQIVQVNVSKTQFAELITSISQGDGIPCTIAYKDGKRTETCPEVNSRQVFQNDFEKEMKEVTSRLASIEKTVTDALSKPSISKKDKEEIYRSIEQMKQQINSNLPYIRNCFEQSVEKTLSCAKNELVSFQPALIADNIDQLKIYPNSVNSTNCLPKYAT